MSGRTPSTSPASGVGHHRCLPGHRCCGGDRARRAGADVAFTYRSADAEAEKTASAIRAAGRNVIVLKGDTGDPMHVQELADRVVSDWGGIDVWVNNAAALMVKPFLEMSSEDWHGLLAANLHGYYYGCRAAIKQMVAQGNGGRVINVTSVVGHPADRRPLGLRHREGRDPRADEDARRRVRAAADHRQRALARGDGHTAQPGRLHAAGARDLQRADPARPHRLCRGDRRPVRLPRLGRVPVRHGNGARRRRRHRPQRQRRPREDRHATRPIGPQPCQASRRSRRIEKEVHGHAREDARELHRRRAGGEPRPRTRSTT